MRLRLAVLSKFISENPRSQMDVSMAPWALQWRPGVARCKSAAGWSCLRSGRRGARKRKGVWEYTHVRVPHHSRLEAAILACNRASVAAEVAEEDGEVLGQELDPLVPT